MKKLLALLFALVLMLCLAACGEEPQKEEAPAETVRNLETEFGISLTTEGEQVLSDQRAAKDRLIEAKDVWLEGKMTFALAENPKTYEDFVTYIGCDASLYNYNAEKGERSFVWIAQEDETAKLLATFWETPQGWTLYSIGANNLSG